MIPEWGKPGYSSSKVFVNSWLQAWFWRCCFLTEPLSLSVVLSCASSLSSAWFCFYLCKWPTACIQNALLMRKQQKLMRQFYWKTDWDRNWASKTEMEPMLPYRYFEQQQIPEKLVFLDVQSFDSFNAKPDPFSPYNFFCRCRNFEQEGSGEWIDPIQRDFRDRHLQGLADDDGISRLLMHSLSLQTRRHTQWQCRSSYYFPGKVWVFWKPIIK